MEYWKACSSCKKEIGFSAKYYECSVSTCTGKRTGYVFCSFDCFERHFPGARHRDAGAIEHISPSKAAAEAELAQDHSSPIRRIISSPSPSSSTTGATPQSSADDDILIVVSKMKNYIREKSEMNTSGDVADVLSNVVRRLCDEAIVQARHEGRKTVMGRDFKIR